MCAASRCVRRVSWTKYMDLSVHAKESGRGLNIREQITPYILDREPGLAGVIVMMTEAICTYVCRHHTTYVERQ